MGMGEHRQNVYIDTLTLQSENYIQLNFIQSAVQHICCVQEWYNIWFIFPLKNNLVYDHNTELNQGGLPEEC